MMFFAPDSLLAILEEFSHVSKEKSFYYDENKIDSVFQSLENEGKKIDGVIHLAGLDAERQSSDIKHEITTLSGKEIKKSLRYQI